MLDRATLIAAILGPLFVGALIVTAIMADRESRQGPERIETVRYVTSEPEIETRTVYVDRIVPQERIVVVEVPAAVPLREEPIVQAISVLSPTPVPPDLPPAIVPTQKPPPVVVVAVCEHRGKGVGKQVGVCRKQGFP